MPNLRCFTVFTFQPRNMPTDKPIFSVYGRQEIFQYQTYLHRSQVSAKK